MHFFCVYVILPFDKESNLAFWDGNIRCFVVAIIKYHNHGKLYKGKSLFKLMDPEAVEWATAGRHGSQGQAGWQSQETERAYPNCQCEAEKANWHKDETINTQSSSTSDIIPSARLHIPAIYNTDIY